MSPVGFELLSDRLTLARPRAAPGAPPDMRNALWPHMSKSWSETHLYTLVLNVTECNTERQDSFLPQSLILFLRFLL